MLHFTKQGIDGRWHAVYKIPGCGSLHSIGDAPSEEGAKQLADEANREARRRAASEAAERRLLPPNLWPRSAT